MLLVVVVLLTFYLIKSQETSINNSAELEEPIKEDIIKIVPEKITCNESQVSQNVLYINDSKIELQFLNDKFCNQAKLIKYTPFLDYLILEILDNNNTLLYIIDKKGNLIKEISLNTDDIIEKYYVDNNVLFIKTKKELSCNLSKDEIVEGLYKISYNNVFGDMELIEKKTFNDLINDNTFDYDKSCRQISLKYVESINCSYTFGAYMELYIKNKKVDLNLKVSSNSCHWIRLNRIKEFDDFFVVEGDEVRMFESGYSKDSLHIFFVDYNGNLLKEMKYLGNSDEYMIHFENKGNTFTVDTRKIWSHNHDAYIGQRFKMEYLGNLQFSEITKEKDLNGKDDWR